MSPAASIANRTERALVGVKRYQTELLVLEHGDAGSSASTVASAVVPLIVTGSVPMSVADARASFAGGAAAAGDAPRRGAVSTATTRTASDRVRVCGSSKDMSPTPSAPPVWSRDEAKDAGDRSAVRSSCHDRRRRAVSSRAGLGVGRHRQAAEGVTMVFVD